MYLNRLARWLTICCIFRASFSGASISTDFPQFPSLEHSRESPARLQQVATDWIIYNSRSTSTGPTEVYAVRADGSGLQRIPSSARPLHDVTPDGMRRVGLCGDSDAGLAVCVRLVSEPSEYSLLVEQLSEVHDQSPALSPDGSLVAFHSQRDGYTNRIYIVGIDGSGLRNISDIPQNSRAYADRNPVWSPQGDRISAESMHSGHNDILVMTADGSSRFNLTESSLSGVLIDKGYRFNYGAAWSPDGQYLALTSRQGNNDDIYVLRPDGADVRQLTDGPTMDCCATWSLDGRYIAFVSARDGNSEIYVMDSDGANEINVSVSPAEDYGPTWAPVGWAPPGSDQVAGGPITKPEIQGVVYGLQPSTDDTVVINGIANAGLQVRVFRRLEEGLPLVGAPYGEDLGAVDVSESGEWLLTGIELRPGTNIFTAIAEREGVDSEPSEPYRVFRPEAPVITYPPSENGWASIGFIGDVGGTSTPGTTIHLYQRAASEPQDADRPYGDRIEELTIGSDGNWIARGVALQPGRNVFVAFAEQDGQFSEPSEQLYVGMPVASTYGASYSIYLGGEYFEMSDTHIEVSMETLDTRDEAETTARLLGIHGYDSFSHLNASAGVAQQYLPDDQVFYFTGHGSNRCISFEDETGSGSGLCASTLDESIDLSGLQLAVLNACKTGKDPDAPDSIMTAFLNRGTETVIGFNHTVEAEVAQDWNSLFWSYVLADGYTVGTAAYQAASDTDAIGWWWPIDWGIDPDTVVVLGNYDLTLGDSH